MQISFAEGNLIFDGVRDFDLLTTLDCGQFFRFFMRDDGNNDIRCADRRYIVRQEGCSVFFLGATEEDAAFLTEFFDFNRDYGKIKADFSAADPVICEACKTGGGIRILRQEPFETLISFILSQNSNIPRIKQNIRNLCENFGMVKSDSHGVFHAFPTPERLASLSLSELDIIRCGFRGKYLLSAAQDVTTGRINLEEIAEFPYEEAKKRLINIYGVGEKVANCVLLFGFQKLSAFPIDVWIQKVISSFYCGDLDPSVFGEHAGIAQQYLFYYARKVALK